MCNIGQLNTIIAVRWWNIIKVEERYNRQNFSELEPVTIMNSAQNKKYIIKTKTINKTSYIPFRQHTCL